MRRALMVGLLAVAAIGLGCQSSSRAPAPPRAPTANVPNPNRPFWDQTNNDRRGATLNTPNAGPRTDGEGTRLTAGDQPDSRGILAGVLVDAFGGRPAKAYVQVAPADAGGGKPIELAADENGYFMIPGLTPGRSYMLTARTQESGRLQVGRLQATVPNSRLYIKLREDLATNDVPPVPPSPGDMLRDNNRNVAIPGPGRAPGRNPPGLPDLGVSSGPRADHDGGCGSDSEGSPRALMHVRVGGGDHAASA